MKRYKNYWLKSILLITDYDELSSELKDTEIINTFNDDPKYLEDLVKSRNIEQFVQVAISINEQIKSDLVNIRYDPIHFRRLDEKSKNDYNKIKIYAQANGAILRLLDEKF